MAGRRSASLPGIAHVEVHAVGAVAVHDGLELDPLVAGLEHTIDDVEAPVFTLVYLCHAPHRRRRDGEGQGGVLAGVG